LWQDAESGGLFDMDDEWAIEETLQMLCTDMYLPEKQIHNLGDLRKTILPWHSGENGCGRGGKAAWP